MNNENKGLCSSNMGVEDSGASSCDCFQFQEIERLINLVMEDCPAIVQPSTSTYLTQLTEEKTKYVSQIASNIKEIGNNFQVACDKVNDLIDAMTRKLKCHVDNRKKELKNELRCIAIEKLKKWDSQLNACNMALAQLQRNAETGTESDLDLIRSNKLLEGIQFIDAGDIKLELTNFKKITTLVRELGTIKFYNQSLGPRAELFFKGITPKFTFGSGGNGPGQLCRAWGVCADVTGRILVCDRSNHRVQIFNECGEFLLMFGKEGSAPGEFNRPSGIEVDRKNRIVVADKDNHRVQVFTFFGSYLFHFGREGSSPGHFMYPWDVATNSQCHIAVSDSKNHRVQLFSKDGVFLTLFDASKARISSFRIRMKFLESPRGIAFRPDDTLLITEFENHHILFLDPTFTQYHSFGVEGSGPGQFFRPQGIACDSQGNFVVSDSKNYRIQMYDARKNLLKFFGVQGNKPGEFDCPQGICFHPNQSIIVVDFNNNRVQVF